MEYIRIPAAGEERRIGSEKKPPGSNDIERSPEHGLQIFTGVARPTIGARGIEIHVRTEIAQHERLAEVTGAKVRNDKRELGVTKRDSVNVDRIGETHIERRQ